MASGIQYQKDYQRAETAYINGNYEKAAEIIDNLAHHYPHDPNILLLRGHLYCYFQNFEQAQQQYNLVIENTDQQDFIECAQDGLENVKQWQENEPMSSSDSSGLDEEQATAILTDIDDSQNPATEIVSEQADEGFDSDQELTQMLQDESEDPVAASEPPTESNDSSDENNNVSFAELSEQDLTELSELAEPEEEVTQIASGNETNATESSLDSQSDEQSNTINTNQNDDSWEQQWNQASGYATQAESTFIYSSQQSDLEQEEEEVTNGEKQEDLAFSDQTYIQQSNDEEQSSLENTFGGNNRVNDRTQNTNSDTAPTQEVADSSNGASQSPKSREQFSEDANSTRVDSNQVESRSQSAVESPSRSQKESEDAEPVLFASSAKKDKESTAELFSSDASSEAGADTSFDDSEVSEPVVEQDQGPFAFLYNAPLAKKNRIISYWVGGISAVAFGLSSLMLSSLEIGVEERAGWLSNLGRAGLVSLVGGVVSGGSTYLMGYFATKQMKRSTGDLQAQLYALQQGNFESAQATVYSRDELGQLATGFNQMARVVYTTTSDAQRKAQEQEQAKEDLQRQVIRLLDDVEGAARGDLTVQAEVSADVLGAVADAFNLTIRNLRTIVAQVKKAAHEVNEGAAESASFAQGLSEDALKQAEELAVSLNSAQMMTESIQRVADNAKEAESVARQASETALKGGEAVDSTVSGILQIRETVAQSTRKVKRLAESSQEISKIVSVISQIATRTNNLALNASIEAARAGEAGRGFAVIADEVRQLADRSTKSLREIEKIVHQIQSETSAVMTAMEEGTQQVIEGTQRAEQAKNALEDIIQVSNRIDSLVQSITADTVEQSETAQSVAQVMQSVEKTAQGTSQESQQVSTALQNLVTLAGDLLASVERFQVKSDQEQNQSQN